MQIIPPPLVLKPTALAQYFEVSSSTLLKHFKPLHLNANLVVSYQTQNFIQCTVEPIHKQNTTVLRSASVLQKREPFSLMGFLKTPYGLMAGQFHTEQQNLAHIVPQPQFQWDSLGLKCCCFSAAAGILAVFVLPKLRIEEEDDKQS